MHGARVIALRGNFDQALEIVTRGRRAPSGRARQLDQPVPDRGPEDGRVRGLRRARAPRRTRSRSRSATPATSRPGGGASASTARACRALYGFQAEGAAPIVLGQPVEQPETVASAIRIGNPARWQEAVEALEQSGGRIAAVSDDEILEAQRWLASVEGVFCEPASAASRRGRAQAPARRGAARLRAHRPRPEGPGDRASSTRRGVVACDPELAEVERACWMTVGRLMGRRRKVRVPASSANLGPGFDAMAAAVSLHLELEVEETGEFSVDAGDPALPDRRDATSACGRSPTCIPSTGLSLPDPLRDPAHGGTRVERRGDRRGAAWRPTTCSSWRSRARRSSSARRGSRATPTTSPPRSTAAS